MKTELAFTTVDLNQSSPARSIIYKRVGDAELRLHVFEPSDTAQGKRHPAIVFFFGGGWITGNPSQFFPQCQVLADQGMVAMSAEYRIHSIHNNTPRESVQDARSCLRWIRGHAKELGIDPDRIAAGGGSAGGHLAASTTLNESFDEVGENFAISCRPDALLLFNPVLDNSPEGYGNERVQGDFPRISPAHNVSAGWPPTLVMVGTADELIPVSTMERFRDEMTHHQNYCELVVYPGATHGFFNFDRPDNTAFYETLDKMKRHFRFFGFL